MNKHHDDEKWQMNELTLVHKSVQQKSYQSSLEGSAHTLKRRPKINNCSMSIPFVFTELVKIQKKC